MKKLITERLALNGLLSLLALFILFHLLIILDVVPYGLVWGGRIKDRTEMLTFEAVSIIINVLMVAVYGIRAGYLIIAVNYRLLQIVLWAIFVIFVMNTLGNLLSVNQFERMLLTPITLILSILSLRVALMKAKGS